MACASATFATSKDSLVKSVCDLRLSGRITRNRVCTMETYKVLVRVALLETVTEFCV